MLGVIHSPRNFDDLGEYPAMWQSRLPGFDEPLLKRIDKGVGVGEVGGDEALLGHRKQLTRRHRPTRVPPRKLVEAEADPERDCDDGAGRYGDTGEEEATDQID